MVLRGHQQDLQIKATTTNVVAFFFGYSSQTEFAESHGL
jgi:hypothetical protein